VWGYDVLLKFKGVVCVHFSISLEVELWKWKLKIQVKEEVVLPILPRKKWKSELIEESRRSYIGGG